MKRHPNESYEDYRKRRDKDNTNTRIKLRPNKLFWHGSRGQYVRQDNAQTKP